jgi:hypothetical protein
LVGLDRQQVVGPLVKEDLLRGFHLGVQRVGQHQLAAQVQAPEHLASGGDFVGLGRGDHPA